MQLVALLLWAAHLGSAAESDAKDPFAPCDAQVRSHPSEGESYRCFYTLGLATRRFGEAKLRLSRLARGAPENTGNAWAILALGHVATIAEPAQANALYREAAESFARLARSKPPPQNAVLGEVQARYNLQVRLRREGQDEEASAELALALSVAEAGNDPLALGLALLADGIDHKGGDLGRAARSLRRAEALLFPGGTAPQRSVCLTELGGLAFRLGNYDEALSTYRRLLDLTRAEKDYRLAARTAHNLALTRQRQLESEPEPHGLDEVEVWSRVALDGARRESLPDIEQPSLLLLGEIARARGQKAEARIALESSLAMARRLDDPASEAAVLWALADLTAPSDPEAAKRYSREAMRAAQTDGGPRTLAYAVGARSQIDWLVLPHAAAVASGFQALSAIESLRTLQLEEESRIGLFSAWTKTYRWLAGRLLDSEPPDLLRAFEVMERMRGRFLLESLTATGAPKAPFDPEAQEREKATVTGLAAVQLRLLDAGLKVAERSTLRAEQKRRELDLAEARAGKDPAATAAAPVALGALRAQLGADEALLLFQLGSWRDIYGDFAGGSWAIVLTRGEPEIHRLPDRAEIETLLPLFLGLLERRDGKEGPAAARLGEMLLGSALRGLPKEVRRLVIIPDGALYNLPWDALRPSPSGEPLGLSYDLAVAPSATLFARWRSRPLSSPSRGALVFADPKRPNGERPAATRGAASEVASLAEGARFGPLPYARREGEDVADRLPRSELLVGEQATERELSRTDLAPFAAIHFAAHAIADAANPDRSAVVLADGLLQPREIAALPLAGKLAVLSACRTADGAVISGEGTMSLARAFFQAGAPTVIGSRWPLADDEAERLSASFYRALSAGETAGSALRQARREAAEAGLPPAAWAGLVLMGDPSFTLPAALQRPPRSRRSIPHWIFGLGGLLLGVGAAFALRRRVRRRRIG